MITPEDIMRDKDVAKLAGMRLDTFQRKMRAGFSAGELNWPAADPVTNGRERLWFRRDVERVWRERIRVAASEDAPDAWGAKDFTNRKDTDK